MSIKYSSKIPWKTETDIGQY